MGQPFHPFTLTCLLALALSIAAPRIACADQAAANAAPNTGKSVTGDASDGDSPETLQQMAREMTSRREQASRDGGDSQDAGPTTSSDAPPSRASQNAPRAAADRPSTQPLGEPSVDPNELKSLGNPESAADAGDADEFDTGGSWIIDTLAALGVVIGLVLLLRWAWLRATGRPSVSSTPAVEVLSRTAVAPKNHVLLLRVGERVLVVSDSSTGMRTLANVDDEQEVADLLASVNAAKENSVSGNFRQLLGRFGQSHEEQAWGDLEDGRDEAEHVFDRARDNVTGLKSRIRNLSRSQKGGDL